MRIYFLRHGVAFDAEQWEGEDFDRPLTPDGKDRMKREAKGMDRLDVAPEIVVTSPLVRAKQTAAIVAQRLRLEDRVSEDSRAGPDLDGDVLRTIVASHTGAASIMLVGHEPSMSATIGAVTGGSRVDLKKGGLACVEFDETSGTGILSWLLTPKVLLV